MGADDESYLHLCPQGWAWEWMRRNSRYQQYAAGLAKVRRTLLREKPRLLIIEQPTCEVPREWGLLFAEEAGSFFGDAAVFWGHADKSVLPVFAFAQSVARTRATPFDITQFPLDVTVLEGSAGGEEVLISDGVHSIQLHVAEGSVLGGPVQIAHVMNGMQSARDQLATFEHLSAVRRLGAFSSEFFPPDPRARRWLLALRAFDFARAGLSHSEIADRLYSFEPPGTEPRFRSDWARSRVRRLLALAWRMVSHDYLLPFRQERTGRQSSI